MILTMVRFAGLIVLAESASNGDMRWSAQKEMWIAIGAVALVAGQLVSILQNVLLRMWQKESKKQMENIEKKTDEVKETAKIVEIKLNDNTAKTEGNQRKMDDLQAQFTQSFVGQMRDRGTKE